MKCSPSLAADSVTFYSEVDFGELVDVFGRRVDGLPTEGRGVLVVIDLKPQATFDRHPYVWTTIRQVALGMIEAEPDEYVKTAVHPWPPKEE